jgi:anthranilate phosphoribosyltransferase
LSNPAGVKRQLVGVFARDLVEPMLTALKELGAVSAAVVHGAGGLDEFSVVRGGTNYYTSLDKFGHVESAALPVDQIATLAYELDEIRGGEAPVNAFELRALLGGSSANRAYRAAVTLNASAALGVAGRAGDWKEGVDMAEESLRGGAALKALDKLVEISRTAP